MFISPFLSGNNWHVSKVKFSTRWHKATAERRTQCSLAAVRQLGQCQQAISLVLEMSYLLVRVGELLLQKLFSVGLEAASRPSQSHCH